MADDILKELWKTKDETARENSYDLDALVAYLNTQPNIQPRTVTTVSGTEEKEPEHRLSLGWP